MSIANDPAEPDDLCATVPTDWSGQRLDAAIAQLFPSYSRSRLSQWLKAGYITANGKSPAGKSRVIGGEEIVLALPAEVLKTTFEESLASGELSVTAEPVPLEVVHQDDSVIVLNKSIGLVMHPAPGNRTGTVMNGLFEP